jgi:protein-disulfide isomerase
MRVCWIAIVALSLHLAGSAAAQSPASPESRQTVVATVGGQAITEEELVSQIAPQMQQLKNEEFQLKQDALESLIDQKVLEAEARRRTVSTGELLEQEVNSKLTGATEAEIEAFYEGQKDRINRPLAEVKDQIRQVLDQTRLQQLRQTFYQRLRQGTQIDVFLSPPRLQVASDPERTRGASDAPVTIVEFSDFQCPYCQKAYVTVRSLLEKYPDKVRLAYRDFPLSQIHPQADLAAEASRCALEQGKFWEYHDLLFENPSRLDREFLEQHAAVLALDGQEFAVCLDSGRHKPAIEQDRQEGLRAGVSGTPGFFINGIFVSGAQPLSAFEKIIDSELAAKH